MLTIAPDTILQQRYRILNLLEDRDLERTYLATDSGRADVYCAIAEILVTTQSSAAAAQAREFFKREITPLYQLQHPQIARFWTTFEEQNRLFLVRDYVAGTTYGQILAQRRDLGTVFTEAEVWQFLLQILPAIGYTHSKGIIHRDISPAHIVCREGDRLPVLIDFGVFKEFANKLQAPNVQMMTIGQPGYAPHEQLYRNQVYPSTDLYALAVTAIVLLTGKEPSALFEGERMDWNWLKWTQLGDEFATILSRMLSLDPQDRYQSALEVNRDLQALDAPQRQLLPANQAIANRPSSIPTVAIDANSPPSDDPNPVQTAITNLNDKSIWEKPLVFIPAGVMIALLAGFGSWFGVSQLLRRQSPDLVASTPPKQIDFDNPTIPTDSSSPSSTTPTDSSSPSSIASDLIQPEMDRSIVKEGTVDANTPVRYRIAAVAGQNLDIQLIPTNAQNSDATRTSLPKDPAQSMASPIDPLNPNLSQSESSNSNNPPISVPTPQEATQVLMTIRSPTGTPIDSQSNRVIGWRGQLPTAGDYTIELRPIKGLDGSTFPYKLSVTQVAVTSSPLPIGTTTPSPGSSTPSGVPVPDLNGGIAPMPTQPNSNSPDNNNSPGTATPPSSTVVPVPTPTESARPQRKRIRRIQAESSPQRERNRAESTEEATPTPRRRRERVESTEEATPTPRRRRDRVESTEEATPTPRRRDRQTESAQPKPSASNSPAAEDNGSINTRSPEPSVAIPVPAAKTGGSQPNRTDQ
jgi:serine/threonine protein kinase